jgi:hypothetical protein
MPQPSAIARRERLRNLLFFSEPVLWPVWPFLPVIRRTPGREDQCGLLYDGLHAAGRAGVSATVYLCNLFELPPRVDDLLALPREAFDTPEEVYQAGWRID